jgi:hypothetical protein
MGDSLWSVRGYWREMVGIKEMEKMGDGFFFFFFFLEIFVIYISKIADNNCPRIKK